jgi:hypothetical protein
MLPPHYPTLWTLLINLAISTTYRTRARICDYVSHVFCSMDVAGGCKFFVPGIAERGHVNDPIFGCVGDAKPVLYLPVLFPKPLFKDVASRLNN